MPGLDDDPPYDQWDDEPPVDHTRPRIEDIQGSADNAPGRDTPEDHDVPPF